MPHDYESFSNAGNLSDEELRALVRERLDQIPQADMSSVLVQVEDGRVRISGRVGTEGERRLAERTLTDVAGVADLRNELMVDPIMRDQVPEAADEAAAENDADRGILGDSPEALSPEAEHLEEDLDGRLYGTTDVGEAIAEGLAYEPPTTPTPEGLAGDDDDPEVANERH